MKFNWKELKGNWYNGCALDLHTISSTPLPGGGFDTQRTEIGEMLYRLKYRFDKNQIEPLAQLVARFIKKLHVYPHLSAIIPVPPSNTDRPFQPVEELALSIGKKVNRPVPLDYLQKIKETQPLKGIDDTLSRKRQLRGAFKVTDRDRFTGKYVLLFDDIYRSGETLWAVTEVLLAEGRVARVYVLTLTKTRTKQ